MVQFPEQWPLPERRIIEGRYCRLEPLDPQRHGAELFEAVTGMEMERLHRWLADPLPVSWSDFEAWLVTKAESTDPLYFAVIDKCPAVSKGVKP